MVLCAFGFGVGGLGLVGRSLCLQVWNRWVAVGQWWFVLWGWWVGVGRSWFVRECLGLVSAGLCFWVWEVGGLGVAHLGAMLAHLGGYVGPSWGDVGPPWGLCCTGLRLGGPIFGVGGVGLVSDGLCFWVGRW